MLGRPLFATCLQMQEAADPQGVQAESAGEGEAASSASLRRCNLITMLRHENGALQAEDEQLASAIAVSCGLTAKVGHAKSTEWHQATPDRTPLLPALQTENEHFARAIAACGLGS